MILQIESIAYLGSGVARHEGKVIFVPLTCVGETVDVEIVEDRERFARGRVTRIVEASPDRLPGYHYTPGCCYVHMSHAAELDAKKTQLEYFIKHPVAQVISSRPYLNYRNKIRFEAGANGTLGYLGEDNTSIVDMPQDPLAHPAINLRLTELRADRTFMNNRIPGHKTILRYTPRNGVHVWQNTPPNLVLTEQTCLGDLLVHAGGFFQVNPPVTDLLLEHVTRSIRPCGTLLDLYCGVGGFALSACRDEVAQSIFGYEYSTEAVVNATQNAVNLHLDVRFRHADIEQHIGNILALHTKGKDAAVIVDPPRRGLTPTILQALCDTPPHQLCYISCSPDTLARDLGVLKMNGFTIQHATLFDMFPRTAHFESVVILSHQG